MSRIIERALERHLATTITRRIIFLFFLALGIALVNKAAIYFWPQLAKKHPWLFKLNYFIQHTDSIFTITVGALAVFGILLTFFAVKGLFERVRDFNMLLDRMGEMLEEIEKGEDIQIICYYLSFGIVTMGHTKAFRYYIDKLYSHGNESRIMILTEDTKTREMTLESFCENYGFKPEALSYAFENVKEEAEGPGLVDLIKDLPRDEMLSHSGTGNIKKLAGFVFNVYNEFLLSHVNATTKVLGEDDMPDYHVVFAQTGPGIIFIPMLIPEATKSDSEGTAEIIGWRTVDRQLLLQLNRNFRHYWTHRNAQDRDPVQSLKYLKERKAQLLNNI